jgi:tripartite-type tricarboxylate transporter receptor subunit TctC
VAVVTKAGAGGALAMDFVAKARPDGHTIAAGVTSTLTILPATRTDLPYRLADFAVIGTYAVDSQAILAKAGGTIRTLDEMIEHAKRAPGTLSYGSAGAGTIGYFNMELLKAARGIDMTHVPFAGSGPVKGAILGGHVTIASSALSPLLPLVRSGDLIALATTAPKKIPGLEAVPTLVEKGLGDASLSTTMQIFVPARTPKDVVDRLVRALETTAKDPAVVAALEKAGMFAEYQDPETARRGIEREHENLARIARALGLVK